MKLRKILSVAIAAATAATLAVSASATGNAYISFQVAPGYNFRNSFDDASYGLDSGYFNNFIVWGAEATDPDTYGDDYADYFDYDIAGYLLPATYTDAVIDGDGTYTVKAEGIEFGINGGNAFNFVQISTDLPREGGAVITDAKLIIDGTEALTIAEPPAETSGDYLKVNLINIWNPDIAAYEGAFPTSSVEIQFTVSGLGSSDAADDSVPAETDASAGDTTTPTTDKTNSDTGVEGVAAIAGLAIVATGAIIVAKKRK